MKMHTYLQQPYFKIPSSKLLVASFSFRICTTGLRLHLSLILSFLCVLSISFFLSVSLSLLFCCFHFSSFASSIRQIFLTKIFLLLLLFDFSFFLGKSVYALERRSSMSIMCAHFFIHIKRRIWGQPTWRRLDLLAFHFSSLLSFPFLFFSSPFYNI